MSASIPAAALEARADALRDRLLGAWKRIDAADAALKQAETDGATHEEIEALRSELSAVERTLTALCESLARRLDAVEAAPRKWRFHVIRDSQTQLITSIEADAA